jgi:hypothetical protein
MGLTRPDLPPDKVGAVLNSPLLIAPGSTAQLPTQDAAQGLRAARHPTAEWEAEDTVDIAYLACAVVHCDVVVTEKQWVREIRHSGPAGDDGFTVIADTAAPIDLLA